MSMPTGTDDDPVNHPSHYTRGKFETIDVIEDIVQYFPNCQHAFLAGQVVKYVARAPNKCNYVEDLQKAHWYLTRLIEKAKADER
jgi:hypothetical protein